MGPGRQAQWDSPARNSLSKFPPQLGRPVSSDYPAKRFVHSHPPFSAITISTIHLQWLPEVDLWSQMLEADDRVSEEKDALRIGVIYRRKSAKQTSKDVQMGRTSIAISENESYKSQFRRQDPKRKPKQAAANKKTIQLMQEFVTERAAFFKEVDSFDLVEESPSPKNLGRWVQEHGEKQMRLQDMRSAFHPVLRKWLRKQPVSYGSASLTDILETQLTPKHDLGDAESSEVSDSCSDKLMHQGSSSISLGCGKTGEESSPSLDNIIRSSSIVAQSKGKGNVKKVQDVTENGECENDEKELEVAVERLSLYSSSSSSCQHVNAFTKLLKLCGQSSPSTLSDAFSEFWLAVNLQTIQLNLVPFLIMGIFFGHSQITNISKVGEGTYGEAFKGGGCVFKIVPIDGDFLVNGEVQKRSSELLEEVLLSLALNSLRGHLGEESKKNTCKNFIETRGIRVCQGAYEEFLIKAWQDWDLKHTSENDHPESFPKQQCYVVFILEDGGKDLESFVLKNFDEARSLLIQVTAALAVAEVACEFEHRDLHWGNILLSHNSDETVEFVFKGQQLHARTFGLSISIIDFTLSRMNNGNSILFMDLASDPALFEGPKGDKQSETYRKMLEVTHGCWEESFPKTNVLWLQYLVDVLLTKKTFGQTTKDERELRSLKKRLLSCNSAEDALMDSFFAPLWIEDHSAAISKQ
ncbi:Serine/threonine-protein kinase haspin [Nymphaea thermarum]|nr:Serine/threonine-protein kinase haspin [Nymphaea thermarum]